MTVERSKNVLSLTYKPLNDDGKVISRTLSINNVRNDIDNETAYEVALLLRDLMAYANEKILMKSEDMLLDD